MKTLSKVLGVVILLAAIALSVLIIQSKGPKEWTGESVSQWLEQVLNQHWSADTENNSASGDISDDSNRELPINNKQALTPTPSVKPAKEEVSLYQWKDEKGNLQFTESPPRDRPYKTVKYAVKQGISAAPQTTKNYPRINSQPVNQTPQKNTRSIANNPVTKLQTECRWDYQRLQGYEKKLRKEKSVKDSIWLQDYCDSLSVLVTNNCNLSKKDIRFNNYCPLRYRR